MPGTAEGGRKAAETNKKRYGEGFYKKIGFAGGKKSRNGGFAANPELASLAGQMGGLLSRKNGRDISPEAVAEAEKIRETIKKQKG